jgi:hypothetical protein
MDSTYDESNDSRRGKRILGCDIPYLKRWETVQNERCLKKSLKKSIDAQDASKSKKSKMSKKSESGTNV